MNPATVKQILGEKSVLAMYRDCLRVVPLMNSNVRQNSLMTYLVKGAVEYKKTLQIDF